MGRNPLNVAHKTYSEGSFAQDQHGASVMTSNAFIFGNHMRCVEPHESIKQVITHPGPNGSTAINDTIIMDSKERRVNESSILWLLLLVL